MFSWGYYMYGFTSCILTGSHVFHLALGLDQMIWSWVVFVSLTKFCQQEPGKMMEMKKLCVMQKDEVMSTRRMVTITSRQWRQPLKRGMAPPWSCMVAELTSPRTNTARWMSSWWAGHGANLALEAVLPLHRQGLLPLPRHCQRRYVMHLWNSPGRVWSMTSKRPKGLRKDLGEIVKGWLPKSLTGRTRASIRLWRLSWVAFHKEKACLGNASSSKVWKAQTWRRPRWRNSSRILGKRLRMPMRSWNPPSQ